MDAILGKAAETAHSAVASLYAMSPIKIGQDLPTASVKEDDPTKSITIHDLPGKIIIVGVPGAFTPSCSSQAPGYIEKFEQFQSKGVSQIFIVSVNDAFVTSAWKKKLAGDKATSVRFLADDTAAFISGLGLVFDASPFLGGPRSKRFVIVAEAGKVSQIFVEEDPSAVTVTAADAVLAKL